MIFFLTPFPDACEREIGYMTATTDRNRQEYGRIMVPPYG
jgi:hypothetical protein